MIAFISPTSLAILLAAVFAVWVIVTFNSLVRQRNLMREGWSGIDVQLKRRTDLVPNLVEIVTAYSSYEKTVLDNITRLRNQTDRARDLHERQTSENALTDQIKGLFAVAEAYPDLKAGKNFLDLQKQLAQIEDQIQMARRYYNGAVRNYNICVEKFPSNIVARVFGYVRAEFFQIETATARSAPEVEMD